MLRTKQLLVLSVLALAAVCPAPASTIFAGTCGTPNAPTIMAAVNAAAPGSTVKICPGTYTEQIIINKALTVTGATLNNSDRVKIVPSGNSILTVSAVGGSQLAPEIWVTAGPVNISNIVVTAEGCMTSPIRTVGFYYASGSSGTLSNSIADVNVPCGVGVWAENVSESSGGSVAVQNNIIYAGATGIVAQGGTHPVGTAPLLFVTLTGNELANRSAGMLLVQVGGKVSGNFFGGTNGTATIGIFDGGGSDVTVSGNTMLNQGTGIVITAQGASVTSNKIHALMAAIDLKCLASNVTSNTIAGHNAIGTAVGLANIPSTFVGTNTFRDTDTLKTVCP